MTAQEVTLSDWRTSLALTDMASVLTLPQLRASTRSGVPSWVRRYVG